MQKNYFTYSEIEKYEEFERRKNFWSFIKRWESIICCTLFFQRRKIKIICDFYIKIAKVDKIKKYSKSFYPINEVEEFEKNEANKKII